MTTPYGMTCEDRDGVLVVALSGEVDLSNTGEIEDRIAREIGPETAGLVIDLDALAYLDSSGVRLLLELHDRLHDVRRGFAVVRGPGGIVARVLELVHLGDELAVVDRVDDAVDAVRGAR